MIRNTNVIGPERIKVLIRERGHTYESVGREIGVTAQAIYAIVKGDTTSATARYSLAKALELEVSDLWPDADSLPSAA